MEFREKMELCVYGASPGETIRFLHYDPFGVRDGVLQFENECHLQILTLGACCQLRRFWTVTGWMDPKGFDHLLDSQYNDRGS